MKTEIKSFLWVASAYDNPGHPAYQIDVVETAESFEEAQAIGGTTRVRQGLSVAQASALGLDLSTIAEALNVEALAAREAAETALAAATAERDRLAEMLSAMAPAA